MLGCLTCSVVSCYACYLIGCGKIDKKKIRGIWERGEMERDGEGGG